MKRFVYTMFLVAFAVSLVAEELPVGYYDAIQGKKDSVLKSTLHEIVKGGVRVRYGASTYHSSQNQYGQLKENGTWWAFLQTDRRSDESVYDMYGLRKRYFPIKGMSAAGLEIEHCFPKSWWGASSTESVYQKDDAYRDLYHLNPADAIANTNKSNFPPGRVEVADKFDNGSFRMGKNKDAIEGVSYVFEPADEYKGDFARAYFYIATAYEDRTWVSDYSAYLTNDSYLEFQPWLVDVLLEWHRSDPVSVKELERIDAVSSIQHNRNPYIDYPELVEYIWGNKKGTEVDLQQLVLTSSYEYDCPIESANPTAYMPEDLTENGFTARWKDVGASSYKFELFEIEETGKNDTLLNVPLIKADSLKVNEHILWATPSGAAASYSTTDGGSAFYMSTTTEKRFFIISGLTIGENARLIVKCSVYNKGDQTATLVVTADDEVLEEIEVGLDEHYYTIPLKEGTKEITLSQAEIGSKGNYHRISMQQIFVVEGDYERCEIEVAEDSPKQAAKKVLASEKLTATSKYVNLHLTEGRTVYYRVVPEGMQATNAVAVSLPKTDKLERVIVPFGLRVNGRDITVNTNSEQTVGLYDAQGRMIDKKTAAKQVVLKAPAAGLYIVKTTDGVKKIIVK